MSPIPDAKHTGVENMYWLLRLSKRRVLFQTSPSKTNLVVSGRSLSEKELSVITYPDTGATSPLSLSTYANFYSSAEQMFLLRLKLYT